MGFSLMLRRLMGVRSRLVVSAATRIMTCASNILYTGQMHASGAGPESRTKEWHLDVTRSGNNGRQHGLCQGRKCWVATAAQGLAHEGDYLLRTPANTSTQYKSLHAMRGRCSDNDAHPSRSSPPLPNFYILHNAIQQVDGCAGRQAVHGALVRSQNLEQQLAYGAPLHCRPLRDALTTLCC